MAQDLTHSECLINHCLLNDENTSKKKKKENTSKKTKLKNTRASFQSIKAHTTLAILYADIPLL